MRKDYVHFFSIWVRLDMQGSHAILGSQNPDFFLTIFELFPDFKINKFLALNWVLLETRLYMVTSLFPYKASEAFFPDKNLMEDFRLCLTVFIQFHSSTGHQPDRSLITLTLIRRSRGTQRKKKTWSSIIESSYIMQATYTDQRAPTLSWTPYGIEIFRSS